MNKNRMPPIRGLEALVLQNIQTADWLRQTGVAPPLREEISQVLAQPEARSESSPPNEVVQ